jgi:hypothetical protein
MARRGAVKRIGPWPPDSPGTVNAWLLLVTTKPPKWRDPLLLWREEPPTLGLPHNGFFYPDPLGFWTEVRRWATLLVGTTERAVNTPDALSVTTLLHVGDHVDRIGWALNLMKPAMVMFMDEASWSAAALTAETVTFPIPDPHRTGVVYEGIWGRRTDGLIIGKSPQHPAAHQLYDTADMDVFLKAAPKLR